MNKKSVIHNVAQKTNLPFAQAERVVNAFLNTVAHGLANGERVTITGFGTFEVRKRKARVGRIFHTDEKVHIPEHLTPAFIAGMGLKRVVQDK